MDHVTSNDEVDIHILTNLDFQPQQEYNFPIGKIQKTKFGGVIDGHNHTISNLNVRTVGYASIFYQLQNITIRNLQIASSCTFHSLDSYAASISSETVANSHVVLENVHNFARIIGDRGAAGLIAVGTGRITISNSTNSGEVKVASKGAALSAGICAWVVSGYNISNVKNYGAVSARSDDEATASGIIARTDCDGFVTHSSNFGSVVATGLFSYSSGIISRCTSIDKVTTVTFTNNYGTSIANSNNASYSGGIVSASFLDYITIINAQNFASIESVSEEVAYAGGIIGLIEKNSSIYNVTNFGNVLSYGKQPKYDVSSAGIVSYVSQDSFHNLVNVTNYGAITSDGSSNYSTSGGVVGIVQANIQILGGMNQGYVVAQSYAGGLIGSIQNGYNKIIFIDVVVNSGTVVAPVAFGLTPYVTDLQNAVSLARTMGSQISFSICGQFRGLSYVFTQMPTSINETRFQISYNDEGGYYQDLNNRSVSPFDGYGLSWTSTLHLETLVYIRINLGVNYFSVKEKNGVSVEHAIRHSSISIDNIHSLHIFLCDLHYHCNNQLSLYTRLWEDTFLSLKHKVSVLGKINQVFYVDHGSALWESLTFEAIWQQWSNYSWYNLQNVSSGSIITPDTIVRQDLDILLIDELNCDHFQDTSPKSSFTESQTIESSSCELSEANSDSKQVFSSQPSLACQISPFLFIFLICFFVSKMFTQD